MRHRDVKHWVREVVRLNQNKGHLCWNLNSFSPSTDPFYCQTWDLCGSNHSEKKKYLYSTFEKYRFDIKKSTANLKTRWKPSTIFLKSHYIPKMLRKIYYSILVSPFWKETGTEYNKVFLLDNLKKMSSYLPDSRLIRFRDSGLSRSESGPPCHPTCIKPCRSEGQQGGISTRERYSHRVALYIFINSIYLWV